jgi:hypothetical protein
MCLGPEVAALLASAALATGGSLYNAHQQNKQQNKASAAASQATLDNLARQRKEGERSKQLFQQAVPQQTRPQQDVRLEDATQARQSAINANVKTERDYSPTPGSAPRVVRGAQDRAMDASDAKLAAENAALAKLGGWGDAQMRNRFDLGQTGGQIAENNSFVQGQAGLLPMEQNTAVTKVMSKYAPNPWGDIAMAAGNAGVSTFYPQAPMPTFADVLGLKRGQRKSPRTGLGEVRG